MSRTVSLPLGMSTTASDDRSAIEVELGYRGRGVFVAFVGTRGGRQITVGLSAEKARTLARTLRQAADASDLAASAAEVGRMCPNCVTPWKCNGPHAPSVPPR